MESAASELTIWSLFLEADPVVKGVMLVLAVASIWSWAVAVDQEADELSTREATPPGSQKLLISIGGIGGRWAKRRI